MAPTNPWGKKPVQQSNASIPAFPGLQSPKKNDTLPISPGQKSQYEEIQEDELIALAAIYGPDFHQIETKQGAWKVCGSK
jgi:translation initiation factor 2-alpha kinase 4